MNPPFVFYGMTAWDTAKALKRALVEGYWNLGKRIREDNLAQEYAKGNKTFVQDLGRNLNISDSTIYYSLQAYDRYPNLDQIPEGKNITWNKLITKYLPNRSKDWGIAGEYI